MTEKMIVNMYDVDHENQVRLTAHLDRKIVIIVIEANGHGVRINLPPKDAAELAVNLAETVDDIARLADIEGPVGHA